MTYATFSCRWVSKAMDYLAKRLEEQEEKSLRGDLLLSTLWGSSIAVVAMVEPERACPLK